MNSVIGVRREVRRMQACGSSLLFRIVEHAGPPAGKARYSRDGGRLGGKYRDAVQILKSESSSPNGRFAGWCGILHAPSVVFATCKSAPHSF
jgi:hypothetical protein